MIFLVCSLGIVAGILLIPILWNIKKMVVILRLLVETNQESVQKSVVKMPGIIENIEQISSNVRETTDKLNIAVPVIIQDVECVTNAAKGSLELAGVVMASVGSGISETIATYQRDTVDFIAYIHIFEEVLQIIYRTFSSSK
jgi:hypothetical protein